MASETRNTSEQEIGSTGDSQIERTVFEKFSPAQITVGGMSYAFPALRMQTTGANRLIERERPYRDGAKLDDTGSKAIQWQVEAVFENTINQAVLVEVNGGRPLYPDVLNEVIKLFDVHETADVILPNGTKARARCLTYTRAESFEDRDMAVCGFTFIEDNEDSVDFRSISAPSANANARRLAETTTFDAQSAGIWGPSWSDLELFTSQLEALANAPGNVQADMQFRQKKITGNAIRAAQSFQRGGRTGRDMLLDPRGSKAERKLVQQRDLSARAANEARRGRPRLLTVVFPEWTSLFRVSAIVRQSFDDLLEVNPELDPFFIPANTPVRVFATEELLHGVSTTAA